MVIFVFGMLKEYDPPPCMVDCPLMVIGVGLIAENDWVTVVPTWLPLLVLTPIEWDWPKVRPEIVKLGPEEVPTEEPFRNHSKKKLLQLSGLLTLAVKVAEPLLLQEVLLREMPVTNTGTRVPLLSS